VKVIYDRAVEMPLQEVTAAPILMKAGIMKHGAFGVGLRKP
jgi:hypothetical protein